MVQTQTIASLSGIILFQLLCALAIFLPSKLLFKARWRTSLSLAFLFATLLPWAMFFLGISFFGSHLPRSFEFYFLCLAIAAICLINFIANFFFWLSSNGENSNINAAERERTLRMVEEGKITADEGTELLEALGRANALRGQNKFSRHDILMLIGVSLVVLAFFLPWTHFKAQMPGPFGKISGYQAGYHIGPIGWTIFIIAILSIIPAFIAPKDFLYKISMLQIFLVSLGLVLVLSLMIRAGDRMHIGLLICLVGFILSLVASSAKLKKLAA